MFTQEKKKSGDTVGLRSQERNVIAKNTTIVGDIKSDGDFRIDGTLEGNLITRGKVIIGNSGIIKGTLTAKNADIEGTINGKLHLEKILAIRATANITGEVVVGKLSVEPGATFNATCEMRVVKVKDTIKLNGGEQAREQSKEAFK